MRIFTGALMAALLSFFLLGPATTQGFSKVDTNPYRIAEAFVLRLQAQIEKLPDQPLIESSTDLMLWSHEIVPFFGNEGLVDFGLPRYPQNVQFGDFLGTGAIFHTLGMAACQSEKQSERHVLLNSRMDNPVSSWAGRNDAIFVLVHELQHIQGGTFCEGESEDLEANTQLGSVEILSAMVNTGNVKPLKALLETVRDMGIEALQYDMPATAFDKFYRQVYHNDPIELGRFYKALRYWANDSLGLRDILYKYNKIPFDAIMIGLKIGKIERVQIKDPAPPVPYSGEWHYETHSESFDDAQYLFAPGVLEALVAEVAGH